jgi:hypothetical protein
VLDFYKKQRERRDWEEGRKLAHEVARFKSSDGWSDEEIKDFLKRSRLARETMMLSPFNSGYAVGWQEVGQRDAQHGSCLARRYKSHSYNMGWWNEMVERRKYGWRHSHLDDSFDRMKTLYWDRISDGRSDDYYSDAPN